MEPRVDLPAERFIFFARHRSMAARYSHKERAKKALQHLIVNAQNRLDHPFRVAFPRLRQMRLNRLDQTVVAGAKCIGEAFAVSLESAPGFFERFAISYSVMKLGFR